MSTRVVLIRGVNVGGKNKVPMAELRGCLEDLGCSDVATYIASGNAIVDADESVTDLELSAAIERELPSRFHLHDGLVKVLVLSAHDLRQLVADRPAGFGEQPTVYHSDAIFLMGDLEVDEAMSAFAPREGVDAVWPGRGLVYSQRLSAQRTKSRLNKIMSTPAYKSMTIRSWQTTLKLLDLVNAR